SADTGEMEMLPGKKHFSPLLFRAAQPVSINFCGHLQQNFSRPACRAWMRQFSCAFAHPFQERRVLAERLNFIEKAPPRPLPVERQPCCTRTLERLRIFQLVLVGGVGEGDEHRWLSRRSQFRYRPCA